jgi:hypothetical protein
METAGAAQVRANSGAAFDIWRLSYHSNKILQETYKLKRDLKLTTQRNAMKVVEPAVECHVQKPRLV